MAIFAVATPSRGLVHSRTLAAVAANIEAACGPHVRNRYATWAISHDLPIPDAHNRVTEQILGEHMEVDYIWFVEEDVVPTDENTLTRLIWLFEDTDDEFPNAGIAIADYPMPGEGPLAGTVHRFGGDEILYCGLGCTLVKREVFEALERPYFRTDTQYVYNGQRSPDTVLMSKRSECEYGGQDVAFCMAARQAGFSIISLPDPQVAHAHLVGMGPRGVNQGAHTVTLDRTIERYL